MADFAAAVDVAAAEPCFDADVVVGPCFAAAVPCSAVEDAAAAACGGVACLGSSWPSAFRD